MTTSVAKTDWRHRAEMRGQSDGSAATALPDAAGRRASVAAAPTLVIGLSGRHQNGAVAAVVDGRLVAFCGQERLTRVRQAALPAGLLRDSALTAVLALADRSRDDVRSYVVAEDDLELPGDVPVVRIPHHFAHAAAAFLTAPVDDAVVLVCDESSSPPLTVWYGRNGTLTNLEWPWRGPGFAALYSQCADLFGFGPGECHRVEALARLTGAGGSDLPTCFVDDNGALHVNSDWIARAKRELAHFHPLRNVEPGIGVAWSFQRELGRRLLSLVADIRAAFPVSTLCLGGGLFYNTYFNSLLAESGLFARTCVAPNPGNAGVAAGAALALARRDEIGSRAPVSPFLGPQYDLEAIKAALDNCKLSYDCLSEPQVLDTVVRALVNGQLVGWFQGRMEWAHRALGNRSILASPLSRYVLDQLNGYLKQREPYRAYGLSACEDDVHRYFTGPPQSQWMEYEYTVRDRGLLQHVLPGAAQRVRVQTVSPESRLFYALHKAFAEATGAGVLVNTSFNGFSEPIVCSPRDAIRVFFGTGLDVLVLGGRFVLRK